MTVAELRRALEGVPDDMTVLVYDEGYLTEEVNAQVEMCATNPLQGGCVLHVIWDHSRHPPGTVGKKFFVVS
jgi:hypothetical protein